MTDAHKSFWSDYLNRMTTLESTEAAAQGYESLTYPYSLPTERWMLDNVLKDMDRGNIDHVLVSVSEGMEVWRK